MKKIYRNPAWLRQQYWGEGLSQSEMAAVAGCSDRTIGYWMDKLGVPTREIGRAGAPGGEPDKYRDEGWLREKYVQDGLTTWEMADRAGCGQTTIRRWMQRHGIDAKKHRHEELAGCQFGRLRVLSFSDVDEAGNARWNCACDCGAETTVSTAALQGGQRSCGCLLGANLEGANNPAWKGGVTPRQEAFRKSALYREWRRRVFERDEYTCQVCGETGGDLVVHHLNSFADHPLQRTDLLNGVTMHAQAHDGLHSEYGYSVVRGDFVAFRDA